MKFPIGSQAVCTLTTEKISIQSDFLFDFDLTGKMKGNIWGSSMNCAQMLRSPLMREAWIETVTSITYNSGSGSSTLAFWAKLKKKKF